MTDPQIAELVACSFAGGLAFSALAAAVSDFRKRSYRWSPPRVRRPRNRTRP